MQKKKNEIKREKEKKKKKKKKKESSSHTHAPVSRPRGPMYRVTDGCTYIHIYIAGHRYLDNRATRSPPRRELSKLGTPMNRVFSFVTESAKIKIIK